MGSAPCHLLFCDYEGDFRFSETLSKLGYLVDHIRPDALKHVSVGDHNVFIFSFQSHENEQLALSTCEKLKIAELPTAIILMHLGKPSVEFLNHGESKNRADYYIHVQATEGVLLDALDKIVGCPFPPALKGSLHLLREDRDRAAQIDLYKNRIRELEKKISELEGAMSKTDDTLKPKLQALLKGQKLQFQTETERLKIELSEIEAKLMDRELKIRELESARDKQKVVLEEITVTHEKAQQALREFYQKKLRANAADDSSAE